VTAVPAALDREEISDFQSFGIRAFTTTRSAGTFGLAGPDPVGEVMSRWTDLQSELSQNARKDKPMSHIVCTTYFPTML